MHCLIVYDIPNDRIRGKVADICLDYGLDRIQLSAFVGNLPRSHQETLMKQIKKALGKSAGNIQLVTICEKDWQQRIVIEQSGEKETEKTNQEPTTAPAQDANSGRRPQRGMSLQPERPILWMPEHEEDLPPI